jgi:hypothetical protein
MEARRAGVHFIATNKNMNSANIEASDKKPTSNSPVLLKLKMIVAIPKIPKTPQIKRIKIENCFFSSIT